MNILNTKEDYLNLLQINKNEAKIELQNLLDNRFHWFDVAVLEADEEVDTTHRIIGETDERILQEYKEDSNSRLFMLGFTVEEVERLINES
jgi:hypothetical protein